MMDGGNPSTSNQLKMMEEIEAFKREYADQRRNIEYLQKNESIGCGSRGAICPA